MLRKNQKCSFTLFAGICAAAVALLGVGGYILHKKIVKRRLQELARRQGLNRSTFDMNNGDSLYDEDDYDYEDYDGDGDDDYENKYKVLDIDGFDNLINEIKQGDEDNE